MDTQNFTIEIEQSNQFDKIESMTACAFGPGRFTRSAFRLREGVSPEPELCFVAKKSAKLVGSVRLTKIHIGGRQALLLGPLVVSPADKCNGIGSSLMQTAVQAAKDRGDQLIILVGDLSYYGKFGFKTVPEGQVTLPGPADPYRILACELKAGVLENFSGQAAKFMAAV